MKRYNVTLYYVSNIELVVDAKNEEQAVSKARKIANDDRCQAIGVLGRDYDNITEMSLKNTKEIFIPFVERVLSEERIAQNKKNILNWCSQLACSQGFYGRLLRRLKEDENALTEMALKNFENILQMIEWVEC